MLVRRETSWQRQGAVSYANNVKLNQHTHTHEHNVAGSLEPLGWSYYFQEVIRCVIGQFEIQLLHDDKFHPLDVMRGELTVVVLDHI